MPVDVTYYTDPCSPSSWALEPALRKLHCRFGETLSMRYVMCGMARQFGDPQPLMREILASAASTGMPVDVRLWLETPLGSSHPACIAVEAASEQGDPGPYLRRLREGILCRRRKVATAESLLAEGSDRVKLPSLEFRARGASESGPAGYEARHLWRSDPTKCNLNTLDNPACAPKRFGGGFAAFCSQKATG